MYTNRYKRGCAKVNLLDLFSDMRRQGSIVSASVDVLVRCPKNMFLRSTQNILNLKKSVLRLPRVAPAMIDGRVQAIWPRRRGNIIKDPRRPTVHSFIQPLHTFRRAKKWFGICCVCVKSSFDKGSKSASVIRNHIDIYCFFGVAATVQHM